MSAVTPPPRRTAMAYVQLLGTSCLWGANFVVAKAVLDYWPPGRFAGSRIAVAALLLAALATWRGQRWRLGARAWWCLLAAGAIGVGLTQGLLFGGLRYTTAADGALLMALTPIGTAVALRLGDGERFTRARVLSVVLGAAGAGIVILPAGGLRGLFAASGGDLAILGAMLTASASFLFLRRGLETVEPLSATAITLGAGAVVLTPPALAEHMLPGAGAGWVLGLIAASAVFSMALGWSWWNAGVAVLGASRTVIFQDVVPAITLVVGAAFLHTAITLRDVAGFLLIAGAVVVTMAPDRGPPRTVIPLLPSAAD